MRQVHCLLVGTALGVLATVAVASTLRGIPPRTQTPSPAKKEGKVVVYSTTDTAAANFLIKDFLALYPGIAVEYNDMNSTEVYNRFISERVANAGSADVLWSSSMDLQIKLANDGGALAYASPSAAPAGGQIRGEAGDAAAGTDATGMIRLERVRLAEGAGDHAIRLPLITSMFLGDRWEYLFHQGDLRLRAYGARPLPPGEQWLEIPPESFWVF